MVPKLSADELHSCSAIHTQSQLNCSKCQSRSLKNSVPQFYVIHMYIIFIYWDFFFKLMIRLNKWKNSNNSSGFFFQEKRKVTLCVINIGLGGIKASERRRGGAINEWGAPRSIVPSAAVNSAIHAYSNLHRALEVHPVCERGMKAPHCVSVDSGRVAIVTLKKFSLLFYAQNKKIIINKNFKWNLFHFSIFTD